MISEKDKTIELTEDEAYACAYTLMQILAVQVYVKRIKEQKAEQENEINVLLDAERSESIDYFVRYCTLGL